MLSVVETLPAASTANPAATSTLSSAPEAPNPTVASNAAAFSAVSSIVKVELSVIIADVMSASTKVTPPLPAPLISQTSFSQFTRALTSEAAAPISSNLVPVIFNTLVSAKYWIDFIVVAGAKISAAKAFGSVLVAVPAETSPAGVPTAFISVMVRNCAVVIAVPAFAPVIISILAEPAPSVPVTLKVIPESFPAEATVTFMAMALVTEDPPAAKAPPIRRFALAVTVAAADIPSASPTMVAATFSEPGSMLTTSALATATDQSPKALTVAVFPPARRPFQLDTEYAPACEKVRVTVSPTLPRPVMSNPASASTRFTWSFDAMALIVIPVPAIAMARSPDPTAPFASVAFIVNVSVTLSAAVSATVSASDSFRV